MNSMTPYLGTNVVTFPRPNDPDELAKKAVRLKIRIRLRRMAEELVELEALAVKWLGHPYQV